MRKLHEIARDIYLNWTNVHFAAKPYLSAMVQLDTMDQDYGFDSAKSIVLYFLNNARSWRGPDAKRIKAELRSMVA